MSMGDGILQKATGAEAREIQKKCDRFAKLNAGKLWGLNIMIIVPVNLSILHICIKH